MERKYIHGYSEEEQNRLIEQAKILAPYVFDGLDLNIYNNLLEVGSGVGAETVLMLEKYPNIHITGLEIEEVQVQKAQYFLSQQTQYNNRYQFVHGDAGDSNLNLAKNHYDAAIFIWVLEHVYEPLKILNNIQQYLRQGAKVFAIEVFHSSLHLFPDCPNMMEFWQRGIEYQTSIQGDANIGHILANLFKDAGYKNIKRKAYPMHFGKENPRERSILLNYWWALAKSAVPNMMKAGYCTTELWSKAEHEIKNLLQNDDAIFYYSFVKIEGEV